MIRLVKEAIFVLFIAVAFFFRQGELYDQIL